MTDIYGIDGLPKRLGVKGKSVAKGLQPITKADYATTDSKLLDLVTKADVLAVMKGNDAKKPIHETVAKKIVAEILDKGLAVSTWRDSYPDAYHNLREWYRADLEADVVRILKRQK